MFFTQKSIKNVIFNKTKDTRVRFFIYMSSMCVQLFTAVEVAVLKLCTLVSALRSNMAAISMETNRGEFFLDFLFIFFHTNHNKCTINEWVEK